MLYRSLKSLLIPSLLIMYQLITAPVAFAESTNPDDVAWDGRWAEAGVEGDVYKLAQNGDSLFVAGDFQKRLGADYYFDLLMLDMSDSTWHDIGFDALGFNRKVEWVHFDEETGILYVGGLWDALRNIPGTRNLAKWDGNTWSAISANDMPTGVIYNVQVLRRGGGNPDELFVAGYFDSIGGIAASSIARYREGMGWDNLGADIKNFSSNPAVRDFDYNRGRLWIGGLFNTVDGAPAKCIAIYDFGSDTWSIPNGGPTNGRIYSLDVLGPSDSTETLLIGGSFTEIDDVREFYRAALYDVSEQMWTEPGSGLTSSVLRVGMFSTAIGQESGLKLFLGGAFETSRNGDTLNSLATYNTITGEWQSIGKGLDGNVRDFIGNGGPLTDDLIVAGSFDSTITGTSANGLALNADSVSWEAYGMGTNNAVNDIYIDTAGTKFYVGSFSIFKNKRLIKLAIDGDSLWSPPGSIPFNTSFNHVLARNDTVFVAGTDITIDGVPYSNLVLWDGVQWQPVDTGVTYTIRDMIFGTDGNLYLVTQGGEFAYWDGSQIHNIPVNFVRNGYSSLAYGLANDSTTGDVLIAGSFTEVNGIPSKLVVRWNGADFSPIGPVGVPISVLHEVAFAVIADGAGRVFVGGIRFDGDVWMWNGSNWSIAGEIPLCFDVDAFVSDGCNVWAAGNKLTSVGSCSYGNIARFNGSSWNELGSGVFGPVENLALYDGVLYAVGNISAAGNKFNRGVAVWNAVPGAEGAFAGTVVAPGAGDTLVYGDVFQIEYTVDSTELVQVEYSLDSGATWQILHNRADPNRTLPWIVPDTNAEFCQVRVANAAAACTYTTSDFFTIVADPALEVYRVTRRAGTYYDEPYLVEWHNFNFPNDSASVWPEEHWQAIDYSQWPFPVSTTTEKNKPANPDWGLWVAAYGEDKCYTRKNPPKVVNPTQYFKWKSVRRNPWNGSCYGFTQASLLVFQGLSLNEPIIFEDLKYLFDEPLNPLWRKVVNKFWIYASAKKHRQQRRNYDRDFSTNQMLDTLIASMQPTEYPRGLTFFRKVLEEKKKTDEVTGMTASLVPEDSVESISGHSVVPYMIRNWPDSAGIWYVFVYDNNSPANDSLFFRIDQSKNTWSYARYSWSTTDTTEGMMVDYPVTEFLGYAADPVSSAATIAQALPQVQHDIEIMQSSREQLLLENSNGDRIGQFGDVLYDEIPDGMPLVPSNPDWPFTHPWGYLVPAGAYTMTISSFDSSTTDIMYESDTLMFGYSRTDADSSQTDIIDIGDGFTISNPDSATKNIELVSIAGNDADGYYYTQVNDLTMAQNDSLKVYQDGDTSLVMENNGSAKLYTVILWRADATSNDYTQSQLSIELSANSAQKLLPAWENLSGEPMTILLDEDQDGTYEGEKLADIVLDVEDPSGDASLPGSYQLSQNYPNPFNPATTIEYSLPQQSLVTLEVYNVLGQRIRTLVNQEQAAGVYSVVWDGTNGAGQSVATGVYLYRLQTDTYVETKKMLLLK